MFAGKGVPLRFTSRLRAGEYLCSRKKPYSSKRERQLFLSVPMPLKLIQRCPLVSLTI
jgi:hypothetical protein